MVRAQSVWFHFAQVTADWRWIEERETKNGEVFRHFGHTPEFLVRAVAACADLANEASVQKLFERALNCGFAGVWTSLKHLRLREFPGRPVNRVADTVGL